VGPPLEIQSAADVDPFVLTAAEEVEEWFPGRIDWERFWDRLEEYGFSISDVASPAARKIQAHIRSMRT
jgi:hypothetical protein